MQIGANDKRRLRDISGGKVKMEYFPKRKTNSIKNKK